MTAPKPRERYINKLITKPESEGITAAKFTYTAQVKFAGSSRLRCQYDCLAGEKKNLYHPPNTPEIEISRELFIEYRFGLLMRREIPADPKPTMDTWEDFGNRVLEIEQKAFHAGYPRAFTIAVGTCQYLHLDNSFRPCLYKGKRRPTFEAVGIELLETLELIAWHDYAHRFENDPWQLFALIMLE